MSKVDTKVLDEDIINQIILDQDKNLKIHNCSMFLMDGLTQFELTSQLFKDCAKRILDLTKTVVIGAIDEEGRDFIGDREDTYYLEYSLENFPDC